MHQTNKQTGITYKARTTWTGHVYKSIVERWETNECGIPTRSTVFSSKTHDSRSRAYRYACSVVRAQTHSHFDIL